jgi:hypothetical protein
MGAASPNSSGGSSWKGPSHYVMNPNERPPQNPHPRGFGAMGQAGMDRGTQNTMNEFGQRMDREGFGMFNPMSMLGSPQGGGFNPMQGLFGGGGQQGGQQGGGFNPLQGLFGGGGGGQGGQGGGGFNPFSFLGGL